MPTTVLPVFDPGDRFTQTATAAITGGQVVENSGANSIAPTSGASGKVVGVAPADIASGALGLVVRVGVWELTASGSITAGDLVVSAAAGKVATIGAGTFDKVVGLALTTATDGNPVRVALRLC
jgi:hypothetical protein